MHKQAVNQRQHRVTRTNYKMNTFTFVVAFSTLVLAVSASPVKKEKDGYPVVHGYNYGDKCPAEFFYDDCNFCFCGLDGHSAGCTLKACYPEDEGVLRYTAPVLPHHDFFSETNECTPGQSFYDRCNICGCSLDGKHAACTKMACQVPEKPHIDGYKSGQKCPAGKTFFDECNSCSCGQDGVSAACTLMECFSNVVARKVSLPALPHIDNFSEAGECTPGKHFYDQCNVCHCGPDGKSAACTLMDCAPVDKIHIDNYVTGQKCPAGKTFYDQCNSCHCSADGRSAACTLKACPEYN